MTWIYNGLNADGGLEIKGVAPIGETDEIFLDGITVLAGPNGSGKTVIRNQPDDALFYSNVGDYELTIPTFEEIAALPITCVKFVGDADFESEYKSLRINRRAGAGTLLVVLNADWRRDLLGVDYVDAEKRSPKEMFAETIDGVKVWVNRELRKEHLNKLLDASGGLPKNGWWLADFDGNAFYVYWREPDNSLRMRTFSFDTFFECFPEDLIEEVDYE